MKFYFEKKSFEETAKELGIKPAELANLVQQEQIGCCYDPTAEENIVFLDFHIQNYKERKQEKQKRQEEIIEKNKKYLKDFSNNLFWYNIRLTIFCIIVFSALFVLFYAFSKS